MGWGEREGAKGSTPRQQIHWCHPHPRNGAQWFHSMYVHHASRELAHHVVEVLCGPLLADHALAQQRGEVLDLLHARPAHSPNTHTHTFTIHPTRKYQNVYKNMRIYMKM